MGLISRVSSRTYRISSTPRMLPSMTRSTDYSKLKLFLICVLLVNPIYGLAFPAAVTEGTPTNLNCYTCSDASPQLLKGSGDIYDCDSSPCEQACMVSTNQADGSVKRYCGAFLDDSQKEIGKSYLESDGNWKRYCKDNLCNLKAPSKSSSTSQYPSVMVWLGIAVARQLLW